MTGEIVQALGGWWAVAGFLVVVAPVLLFCAFRSPGSRRRGLKRSGAAPDIDEGIDL